MTATILTVDVIDAPMLQAGPPYATDVVVFVHGNLGSSQERLTNRREPAVDWRAG
jgi:hypothetical protein